MKQKRKFFEKKKQNKRFVRYPWQMKFSSSPKLVNALSLPLSLSLSLSLSLKPTLILSLPVAHTLSLPLLKTCENTHSLSHSLSSTHTPELSHILSGIRLQTLSIALSRTVYLVSPLSLSLSLIHTHTLSLLSLTYLFTPPSTSHRTIYHPLKPATLQTPTWTEDSLRDFRPFYQNFIFWGSNLNFLSNVFESVKLHSIQIFDWWDRSEM